MRRAGLPQSIARFIMRNFVFPLERPRSRGSEGAVIRAATRPPEGRRARPQRLPLSHHTKLTHFLLFLVHKSGRLPLARDVICGVYKCGRLLVFMVCCLGTRRWHFGRPTKEPKSHAPMRGGRALETRSYRHLTSNVITCPSTCCPAHRHTRS